MAISQDEVKKIAHLARLKLDESDVDAFTNNLSNILNLVEQMDQIDTREIKPMAHSFDAATRMREDVITEGNERDAFMALAPESESGLYLVPKVIE